jgi:hypothetical protein
LVFLARAVVSFLITINLFNSIYPTFFHLNIWDALTFFCNELIPSLIIGYTRQRDEKFKNLEKFNLESYDFNKNYDKEINFSNLLRGADRERDNLLQELKDPLLDKEN